MNNVRMNKPFLLLIHNKTQSPDFEALIELLMKRCDEYLEMKSKASKVFKDNRAKREGITVEQIERESADASSKYALRPDEIKATEERRRRNIEKAKSDEELFRWALVSEKYGRERQRRWLVWKESPSENKLLHQELVDFLDENRRLLVSFGESRGWSIPEGY